MVVADCKVRQRKVIGWNVLEYQQLLNRYQLQVGMSRKGNCWDNAVMERCFLNLLWSAFDHYIFATGSNYVSITIVEAPTLLI